MKRQEILNASKRYAEGFSSEVEANLTAKPTLGIAVLACMDARLDLFRLLGLGVGDAHLLRNAGGRASEDALRSLVMSSHWLGTREFVVIHHTGCGLYKVTNDEIASRVEQTTGTRPTFDFLPFDDVSQSVLCDVQIIANCNLLPSDAIVWGAVYNVATGELESLTPTFHVNSGVSVKGNDKSADGKFQASS